MDQMAALAHVPIDAPATDAILAAMLDSRQRHKLLMADRTGAAAWITAVVENLMAADQDATLAEIEDVLRAAAGHSYVIGGPGKFSIVIGMLAAVGAAGVIAHAGSSKWSMLGSWPQK